MFSRLTSSYAVNRVVAAPTRTLLTRIASVHHRQLDVMSRSFAKKRGRPKKNAVKENKGRPEAKQPEPEKAQE